ncbi:MAG: CapA family protein [Thermoleophilia bacterium]|nr:CapA family protein [Thermoleophilia bacterium]
MLGRGVDQILPHPSDPRLRDNRTNSALYFLEQAEAASGPIPKPVDFSYVWGDALEELDRSAPACRIVNLETAVTTSDDRADKAVQYRMHPANAPALTAAGIHCAVLANNHVLDWGRAGLLETLDTLRAADIKTAGAGRSLAEAQAPAVMTLPTGSRVLVFAFCTLYSGVPPGWAATTTRPGVNFLPNLSRDTARFIAARVHTQKRPGDLAIASIHWGGNWGYRIPERQRSFAHRLIDDAAIDLVHGHSSHHAKGIEIYRGKPILYGCGDLINDYEGLPGRFPFRRHLKLMYFPTLDARTGNLIEFELSPLETRRFRLHRPSADDTLWLQRTLDRESHWLGATVVETHTNTLRVEPR